MRADGINPRVGMTVAFSSIFLIFGLMFTMSGTKGEALGPVPLIALGPAVFFPALAVIVLATKTNGFLTWPWPWLRLQACRGQCCIRKKQKIRQARGSPGDLEGLYSTGGSSESSLETSLRSGNALEGKGGKVLRNLKDCCPPGGLVGVQEKPSGFSVMQNVCVGKTIVPCTLMVSHTCGVVPFRDGFITGLGAPPGLPCYYGNVRWGDETIV